MAYYGTGLDSALLLAYVRRYGIEEPSVLKQCRLETLKNFPDPNESGMMVMPEEAAFLSFFLSSLGYRRGVEVGVFTGYSSLAIALALPDDGELVCCEISQKYADIAAGYWREAEVENKISCQIGSASNTLQSLIEEGEVGQFDFMYIDADKEGYDRYYELGLQLVRAGGMIILDNMLWGGKVASREAQDDATLAIKNLNEKIHADTRVKSVLTTIGDGTIFARKL